MTTNTTRLTGFLTIAVIFTAALLMFGCAAKTSTTTTPTVPLPGNVQVANAITALSTANDAAVHAAIAGRNAGSVSAADCATIEAAAKQVANIVLQLDAELTSADTWCSSNITAAGCQQGKMILLLQGVGLTQLNAHLSSSAQIVVAAILTAANALSAQLGGPVL